MELDPQPAPWGRLLACAAVAYRRRLAQTWQVADSQSAAACQAAPYMKARSTVNGFLRVFLFLAPARAPSSIFLGIHYS